MVIFCFSVVLGDECQARDGLSAPINYYSRERRLCLAVCLERRVMNLSRRSF